MIHKTAISMTFLTLALSLVVAGQSSEALAGESGNTQSGGRPASRMSDNGMEKAAARWFADPERGWIRVEERRQPQKKPRAPTSQDRMEGSTGKDAAALWGY